MNRKTLIAAGAAFALTFTVVSASAAEDTVVAKAKITQEQATKIALKKCPNGTVDEGELEFEKGVLVWSFDIHQPDSKNIVEVQVNAVTSSVVDVSIETPAAQAREDSADKKGSSKAEADEKDEKGEKGEKGEAKEKD